MKRIELAAVLGCTLAASVLLGACREYEQDRVLLFEKGVYLGKPDTPIGEDARRALRARIQQQAGDAAIERGGGAPSDVRPPQGASRTSAPRPADALRQRLRGQRSN